MAKGPALAGARWIRWSNIYLDAMVELPHVFSKKLIAHIDRGVTSFSVRNYTTNCDRGVHGIMVELVHVFSMKLIRHMDRGVPLY